MTGNSDHNRSERQGRRREATTLKAVYSEGTIVGTRTGREALVRAMSVLGNAKSKSHRKTHRVEPGDAGRKFMHLTRGDLLCESTGGVSRGRSSEDARPKAGRAKGQRTKREQSADRLRQVGQEVPRNRAGLAITAYSRADGSRAGWWNPLSDAAMKGKPPAERKEATEDAQ
jgi:hypothetical protein